MAHEWDEFDFERPEDGPSAADVERFGEDGRPCPRCGKWLSDLVSECPKCGADLDEPTARSRARQKQVQVIAVVVIVVFLLGYMAYML